MYRAYPARDTVSYSEQTNEQLMLAYVQGDARAFRELFQRYTPLLLGLGKRHLGSESAAQDLVQKTFMRLHGARHDFQEGRELHPWILTIAMNLVRDEWRSRKRKPTTALEYEPAMEADTDDEQQLIAQQRAAAVRTALAALSETDRLIVELHWFQDRGFKEIAEMLGVSQGAARVRAHRASQRLRVHLDKVNPAAKHEEQG